MAKNSVADLKSQKDSRAKQKAQAEAESAAAGQDPWEGKEKSGRVSFRVEQELKDACKEALPDYVGLADGMRELMARIAKGKIEL